MTAEEEGPPFNDTQDMRLLSPEWDTLFGFMIGRLLATGYTPAQIQAKARRVADMVRGISQSYEGAEAAEQMRDGQDTLRRLIEEEEDKG